MRFRGVILQCIVALCFGLLLPCLPARAQNKGEPGKFDFYLLDMPWGPEFCRTIKDVSATCKPQPHFVVHGLWAQNNDGTWPVFCSEEQGPTPEARHANLDITPDDALLEHEWAKHGTCAAVGPERFFHMEHEAFRSIAIPPMLRESSEEQHLNSTTLLAEFAKANPQLPEGSLVLSCREGRLTAVEACFSRDLKPIRCQGLHPCTSPTLTVAAMPR